MDDEDAILDLTELAESAIAAGERPFAAALVFEGRVVERAIDEVFGRHDPTAHAELVVLRRRCAALSTLRLKGHALFTLVEPCVMCCGAVHWSRVETVVFGVSQAALNALTGGRAKPTMRDLLPLGSHPVEIRGPVLETQGLEVLRRYDFGTHRV